MAKKQDAKYYTALRPLPGITDPILTGHTGTNDPIPTFRVQDILAGIGTSSDNDLPDDAEGEEDGYSATHIDLTQDCPTVRLPEILLSEIKGISAETHRVLRLKGNVYNRLPPDIRKVVMKTCQPNGSINDFFKKSQWRMYLQSKWE